MALIEITQRKLRKCESCGVRPVIKVIGVYNQKTLIMIKCPRCNKNTKVCPFEEARIEWEGISSKGKYPNDEHLRSEGS